MYLAEGKKDVSNVNAYVFDGLDYIYNTGAAIHSFSNLIF